MRKIQVRQPSEEERASLEARVRGNDAFAMRRSQMILLRVDEGLSSEAIGERVGRSGQMVRNVLHAFNEEGLSAIGGRSTARPDDQRAFDDEAREQLREMVQQSPRRYGYANSRWSLQRLADVSYREGLTDRVVHIDTVSETLRQMDINWRRAKHWITSPDANYAVKKSDGIG